MHILKPSLRAAWHFPLRFPWRFLLRWRKIPGQDAQVAAETLVLLAQESWEAESPELVPWRSKRNDEAGTTVIVLGWQQRCFFWCFLCVWNRWEMHGMTHDKPIHGCCAIYFPGGLCVYLDLLSITIWYVFVFSEFMHRSGPGPPTRVLSGTVLASVLHGTSPGNDVWIVALVK